MSERIRPPKMPTPWAKKVIAATALVGAVMSSSACGGNTAHSNATTPTNPNAGTNVCPPLDQDKVTELGRHIQDSIAKGGIDGLQGKDKSSSYWAQKHGVQINDAYPYLKKIDASTARQQLAVANKFAQQKYGLTVKLANTNKPKDIAEDLKAIATQLEFVPVSLVEKLDIGTVTLESAEPAKLDPPAGAYAVLDPKAPNDIVIGPQQAKALAHEVGHHLQGEYQQITCTKLVNYDDASFASLNPADFAYTGRDENPENQWKGITFGGYGQKDVREDEATTFDALVNPNPSVCKDTVRSDILSTKVAEVALRANTLAANTGNYLVDRFIDHCTVQ